MAAVMTLTLAGICLIGVGRAQAAISASERQALLELYTSTDGEGWTRTTNWNGAAGTECTWFGVFCDVSETTVLALGLPSNNLAGTIPGTLGSLTNVQDLYLDFNELTGSIPTELGNLANLQLLRLQVNQLTGSIPTELGNLANLRYLELYDNRLTGAIPTELGSLANLRVLRLSSNQLSGTIPTELGHLANLQNLGLHSNQLTGEIPDGLGHLANLQFLYLYGNRLTGSIPTGLGNLRNLRYLQTASNQLTGSIPTELGHLTNLVSLDLRWNALSSTDAALVAFLDSKQTGGDWQGTQTVPMTDLAPGAVTDSSVTLTWTPITYTGDAGGYEIFFATISGGPYTLSGTTADKTASSWTVTGLTPGQPYHFMGRTVTNAGVNNQNTVVSEPSAEVSAVTPNRTHTVRRHLQRAS